MDEAYKYVTENGGLETAASYPSDCRRDRKCHHNYNASHSGAKFVGYQDVQTGDENALKAVIATQVDNEVCLEQGQGL